MQDALDFCRSSLVDGGAVIICDDEAREGEGDLAFAARSASPELVNFALTHARGLLCVSMWPDRATELGIRRLATNGKDAYGTPFGSPISLTGSDSGISAEARSKTIRATASTRSGPDTFAMPGHVATLIAHPEGLVARDGHTEAVLDLLRISGIDGPGVLCEVLRSDGAVANRKEIEHLAKRFNLPVVDIELIKDAVREPRTIVAQLPGR